MKAAEDAALGRLAALMQGAVWQADPATHRTTFISERLSDIVGFTPEQWTAEPAFWESRLHPEDRTWVQEALEGGIRQGEPFTLEYRLFDTAGQVVWVRDLITPVYDGTQLTALGGMMLDITSERDNETALRTALDQFAWLFNGSPVGLAVIAADSGRVQRSNNAFRAVAGLRTSLRSGAPGTDTLWADPEAAAQFWAALQAGPVQEWPAQWLDSRREVREVMLSADRLNDEGDTAFVMMRDVTSQVQARRDSEASERRFRALVQHSSDLITVLQPSGRILYASPAVEAVLGYDSEEAVGRNALDHLHPDDHEAIQREFGRAVFGGSGATARMTSRFICCNGEFRHLEWVATNQLDDPSIQGIVMNSRDVTERVHADQERLETQQTFETLFSASPEAILLVEFAGAMEIVECNDVAAAMRGYRRDELIGQSTYRSLPNGAALLADAKANDAFRERVRAAGRLQFEAEHLHRAGHVYPVEINLALVTIRGREMMLCVERDISERRAAVAALEASQARLIASEKLAGLGRLTAGLAHEINTPLAATMTELHGAARLVQEYRDSVGHAQVTDADHLEIAAELNRAVEAAQRNLTRIGDFIRKIRGHTRDTITERVAFDAVKHTENTLSMLAHEARAAKVDLLLEQPRLPVRLHGEPGRLTQIVTNLVVNALHACAPGSTVTISFEALDGGSAVMRVQDTGSGIPEDVLPRIFEPMFTTKPVGQGTGLGLSIIHDIITGHFGGDIQVQTSGAGTCFTVTFPARPPRAAPALETAATS